MHIVGTNGNIRPLTHTHTLDIFYRANVSREFSQCKWGKKDCRNHGVDLLRNVACCGFEFHLGTTNIC